MTSLHIQHWNEIVSGGAGGTAAAAALARLRDAPWLANVGRPSNRDHEAVRVTGWPDALRMFAPEQGTRVTGTLSVPKTTLVERLDLDEALHRQTAEAANRALDALLAFRGTIGGVVRVASEAGDLAADRFETKVALGDYVEEFIRLLFIEIYAGDVEPRCTYFRDQLGWFLAGLLPCGWEGDWPHGRMRVF